MRTATALTAALAMSAVALSACTSASETAGDVAGGAAPATAPSSSGSGPASGTDAAAALVPTNLKNKQLAYATDASYPPFEEFAKDNKTIVGFDADVMAEVAKRLGVTFKPVNTGFDGILTGIAAGRYDAAISSFSVTEERKKAVDFVTYLQGGAGVAVPKGNPQHLAMEYSTLCGHKIAAQKGTTQAIEQLPGLSQKCTQNGKPAITISLFPSQNDTILALVSGRVEAMMSDSTAIGYQAKLANGKFELAPGPVYLARPTGIALPKGSPLRPAISAAVKEMYADGTMKALAAKWGVPDTNMSSTPGA
jgi:polar amino acid transport system substrate-binding protein